MIPQAWSYINEGENGFHEGKGSAIANLFKMSFREMINDSTSRDFQFIFEGAIEVAEEKHREAQIKMQLVLAEKEAKEKTKMEMMAAKEKVKKMKLKLPCQLSHGGIPCGRTVEDCIAFRKQMMEERSANFAPLNTKKIIMPNVVNLRYRIPNPPKTVLRKIFQLSVDMEALSSKAASNVGNERAENTVGKTCSKNLAHVGTSGLMYEPYTGDLYKAMSILKTPMNVDTMKSQKRKGGPCMHLEVGRDNSVKFLSGKFARLDQTNNSNNGNSNGNRHVSRCNDRHGNRAFDSICRNGGSGVYSDEKLRKVDLSIDEISTKRASMSGVDGRTLSIMFQTASDSQKPSMKNSDGYVTNNTTLDMNKYDPIDEGDLEDEPVYKSCVEDKEAEEYVEYLGQVFLDSTKYETGSKNVLNEFKTGTIVDICKMESSCEDERKHLYFKFYNQEIHSPGGENNDSDDGIYGYCGCVEMAGYARTKKKKRACYSWPFKLQ